MTDDLTLVCPDCGGAIVLCIRRESGATVGATVGVNLAQTSPNGEIAHGSEVQDLDPATNRARPYNQGYDQDFLLFWEVYPLKRDKRKAQSAWRKAVRRLGAIPGATTAAAKARILTGAMRYRDDPNRVDQFTKYAEGWLNADAFDDDPLPPRQPSLGWLDETYRRATHGGP